MSKWTGFLALMFLWTGACGDDGGSSTASGTIAGLAGDGATGTVTFTQSGAMVTMTASVSGVTSRPNGAHGIHLHQVGDCTNNGLNAGDHWNPTNAMHGALGAGSHYGDLGNITLSGGSGMLTVTEASRWCVGCGSVSAPGDVVGRALILHLNADDLMTQMPAGNAGTRIACAVISLDM